MTALESEIQSVDLRQRYGHAFAAYLAEPGEATLRPAYELGRDAVARGLAVLDLAAVHHDALGAVLRRVRDHEELDAITNAARDFLVETLSAFEMVQRGYREARERALLERRHAAMLRQLSNLLADASLALGERDSLHEVLRLVAEQARELTGATRCVARVRLPGGRRIEAAAVDDVDTWSEADRAPSGEPGRGRLSAPLLSLEGDQLGSIEVADKERDDFTALDEAILRHVAQMAAATIDRARLYGRP